MLWESLYYLLFFNVTSVREIKSKRIIENRFWKKKNLNLSSNVSKKLIIIKLIIIKLIIIILIKHLVKTKN